MSSVKIVGEPTDHVYHGAVTVGTTAAAITGTNHLTRGVQLFAPADNSGTIYVGSRAAVTANLDNDTTGFPILADSGVFFPCDKLEDIYCISDAADQKLFYLAY